MKNGEKPKIQDRSPVLGGDGEVGGWEDGEGGVWSRSSGWALSSGGFSGTQEDTEGRAEGGADWHRTGIQCLPWRDTMFTMGTSQGHYCPHTVQSQLCTADQETGAQRSWERTEAIGKAPPPRAGPHCLCPLSWWPKAGTSLCLISARNPQMTKDTCG